jgi:hypothetical protein
MAKLKCKAVRYFTYKMILSAIWRSPPKFKEPTTKGAMHWTKVCFVMIHDVSKTSCTQTKFMCNTHNLFLRDIFSNHAETKLKCETHNLILRDIFSKF